MHDLGSWLWRASCVWKASPLSTFCQSNFNRTADCPLLYLALTASSQMFKMWSLGFTTSDPHSTLTPTLHLHFGIHVQLQSADWFTRTFDTSGAKSEGLIQYFIKPMKCRDQKHIWIVCHCQRPAESQGQPLSFSEEQRPPESWRQRGLTLLEDSAEEGSSHLTTGPRAWRSLPTISICPALWTLSSFTAKTSTVFVICHLLIS